MFVHTTIVQVLQVKQLIVCNIHHVSTRYGSASKVIY